MSAIPLGPPSTNDEKKPQQQAPVVPKNMPPPPVFKAPPNMPPLPFAMPPPPKFDQSPVPADLKKEESEELTNKSGTAIALMPSLPMTEQVAIPMASQSDLPMEDQDQAIADADEKEKPREEEVPEEVPIEKEKAVEEKPVAKVRTPTDYLEEEGVHWLINDRTYKTRWNKDLNRSYVQPAERKSRWDEKPKTFKQGDPVSYFTAQGFSYLPIFSKSQHEIEVLIRKHRIDDLTKRIILEDFEQLNDADLRSPSPPPVYDSKTGLKTNTRELRLKDKAHKERNFLITEVLRLDPSYKPPADYKPPRKAKKIFIPQPKNENDFSINYIGQIIGPGGQTQKRLEKETKCRIQIRGEGSQKQGQRNFERELLEIDGRYDEIDKDEPLHVLLTADTDKALEEGAEMVNAIIQQTEEAKRFAIVTYDHASTKRVWCENCGAQGHKFYDCPEKIEKNKVKVSCKYCGSHNHPTNDCPEKARHRHLHNALTAGVDPKSQHLAIEAQKMVEVQENLEDFIKEVRYDQEDKEAMKAITYQAIVENAAKPYEQQREFNELVKEHEENFEILATNGKMLPSSVSQALVHLKGKSKDLEEEEIPGVNAPTIEELKKIQTLQSKLSKYKVIEKKAEGENSLSLKDKLLKAHIKKSASTAIVGAESGAIIYNNGQPQAPAKDLAKEEHAPAKIDDIPDYEDVVDAQSSKDEPKKTKVVPEQFPLKPEPAPAKESAEPSNSQVSTSRPAKPECQPSQQQPLEHNQPPSGQPPEQPSGQPPHQPLNPHQGPPPQINQYNINNYNFNHPPPQQQPQPYGPPPVYQELPQWMPPQQPSQPPPWQQPYGGYQQPPPYGGPFYGGGGMPQGQSSKRQSRHPNPNQFHYYPQGQFGGYSYSQGPPQPQPPMWGPPPNNGQQHPQQERPSGQGPPPDGGTR